MESRQKPESGDALLGPHPGDRTAQSAGSVEEVVGQVLGCGLWLSLGSLVLAEQLLPAGTSFSASCTSHYLLALSDKPQDPLGAETELPKPQTRSCSWIPTSQLGLPDRDTVTL